MSPTGAGSSIVTSRLVVAVALEAVMTAPCRHDAEQGAVRHSERYAFFA
jgi:hypothetical protein